MNLNLLDLVKRLENHSNQERFEIICQILNDWQIEFHIQKYATGKNIIVNYPNAQKSIGISSHFDVVRNSPGANDNATSVAVCLDMIHRLKTHKFDSMGIIIYFFDEEEVELKGSQAYIKEYGIAHLKGLINLEMLGQGDKFALWSLDEYSKGAILETFENIAFQSNIYARRFDKIVARYADHVSFKEAGLEDSFTITCISDKDLEVAYHYYKAQEMNVDLMTLNEIMSQAPIFKHYHQPTDLSIHLSEEALCMTADAIWKTLLALDK